MSSDAVDRSWRVRDERFFSDRARDSSFSWSDYVLVFGSMLVVALSGFFLGVDAGSATEVGGVNGSAEYEIDGYEIVVLPGGHELMSGRLGFVRWNGVDRMYIRGGRGVFDMYQTCSHEWQHLELVDHGDAHDFIYEYQDTLPVDTCFEFVRRHFGESYVSVFRSELEDSFKRKNELESFSGYW